MTTDFWGRMFCAHQRRSGCRDRAFRRGDGASTRRLIMWVGLSLPTSLGAVCDVRIRLHALALFHAHQPMIVKGKGWQNI